MLLSIPSILLSELGYLGSNQLTFVEEALTSLSFLISTVIYLRFFDKNKPKRSLLARLGLGRKGLTLKNVGLGVGIFLIIVMLEFGIGIISEITGVQIDTNVMSVFAGAPVWFFVFACVVTPINAGGAL